MYRPGEEEREHKASKTRSWFNGGPPHTKLVVFTDQTGPLTPMSTESTIPGRAIHEEFLKLPPSRCSLVLKEGSPCAESGQLGIVVSGVRERRGGETPLKPTSEVFSCA